MTLREKLIVSRNKAGLSQMELAERLGVSRQAVSRWESGDTTPTMDKLKTLAKIYGVSLDWLCSDAADREPPEAAKPEADRPPDDAPAGKEGEKKQKIRAIAIALAIVVIAYLVGIVIKNTDAIDDKWIPAICGIVGAPLGVLALHIVPDFPATDYLTAVAVGIVSGLAATGVNQVFKQLRDN